MVWSKYLGRQIIVRDGMEEDLGERVGKASKEILKSI